ncbi:hypothetical protein SFRURICE_014734 [Spodoptera frugiperda]|nr:hypothetical protein SFRURICE_014734 [Spodoptera frugiperda]
MQGCWQSGQGFGHLLRRTITEFQGSISYLPSATFQQLLLSTYLQSTVHHLPTSTTQATTFHLPLLLRYYPSLLDLVTFATFTSRTAGLPCITDGWTTAEPRATYPLHRLLTRIVVFYRRTGIRQGFGHLLRRTITEFQGSISYLPSATFQQLLLSTYLQSTVHHLPTSTTQATTFHLPLLLRYYPSLLDLVTFATFTSRTAGLPCITDGWTTAEPRATYPLHRLLTRIVVFYRRTGIRYARYSNPHPAQPTTTYLT